MQKCIKSQICTILFYHYRTSLRPEKSNFAAKRLEIMVFRKSILAPTTTALDPSASPTLPTYEIQFNSIDLIT